MSKKATVITLGCAKNSVDSEHIKGSLIAKSIDIVENPENADYIIINTCGFIEASKQESISTILGALDYKDLLPQKKVIVTGCLAQRYYDELIAEIPEVDGIVGLPNEWNIADMIAAESIESIRPSSSERDFHRYPQRILSGLPYAYLQIADGCDRRCAYCAIPLIRGEYNSKPFDEVLSEARWLDANGIKEINLIAQDTGMYGYDLYGRKRLTELLRALTDFTSVEWIRILYLQPYNIDDDLIDAMKHNPLIVPYLDIPFQHASSKILRAMKRLGAGTDFLAQMAWLRRVIPDIVFRTSIIVGFPGETESDFAQLAEFVEQARFDHMGIFEYSAEEGTAAAALDNRVAGDVIRERYHQLTALQDSISQERNEERIGTTAKVLIEHEVEPESGVFEGRAWWQAPEVDGVCYVTGHTAPGQIVDVALEEFDGCDFHGRIQRGSGK